MSSRLSGESANFRHWFGLLVGFAAILVVVSDKVSMGGSIYAYSLPFASIIAISLASLLDRRVFLQNDVSKQEHTPLSLVILIHCSSALVVIQSISMFRLVRTHPKRWPSK